MDISTAQIISRMRDLSKVKDPYAGQWSDWVSLRDPDVVRVKVTRTQVPTTLDFVRAFLDALEARGMTTTSGTHGYARTEDERGLRVIDRGEGYSIRINEGYNQVPHPDPIPGTGILRFLVDSHQKWESGKRKGPLTERIPAILNWITKCTDERLERQAHAKVLDAQYAVERDVAEQRALQRWGEDQKATIALTQATAWREAENLRAYRNAILARFSGDSAVEHWATWISDLADQRDPASGAVPPTTPAVPKPDYGALDIYLREWPRHRPWGWQPSKPSSSDQAPSSI